MRLNLGSGRNPISGWINVDLEQPLPFDDCTVDELIGTDLIEHIRDPLAFMGELWRVARPDATCTFALPYGSSDDAWEDPTHRHPYFINSWLYFSAPAYYRADYGFRGDWCCEAIALDLYDLGDGNCDRLLAEVMSLRNIVARQTVVLRAVKPARPADQSLIVQPPIGFRAAQ